MNYEKLLKQYRVDMIDALRHFVAINSVNDEKTATKEMPFGKGVNDALRYIGELGSLYGFDVDYCDGYATELSIGEGDKLIGIYAHADVVPATGKWTNDPFYPIIKDNRIYGRGTSDDKGPLIAAFYAVKALKDNGLLRNYRVKIVCGGDEELGSRCLHHYFEVLQKENPTYGFTPDSDFPLIYGEKGICDFHPTWKIEVPHLVSLKAGLASNAVCDRAEIVVDNKDEFVSFLKSEKVNFELENDKIIFIGKSCHGSTPELGTNAILICLEKLGKFYNVPLLEEISSKLNETSGSSFGGFAESKYLGKTTYCVGVANYVKGELKLTVNFRYPETVDHHKYVEHFDEEFGSKSTLSKDSPYLLFDPECELVKTLLKAYRAETKDNQPPMFTGGGTYAKHAKNTVAFGALFPNRESTMHEPDEYMDLDEFFKAAVIYAHAIDLLGKLK